MLPPLLLLAERRHVVLAPVVLVLVRSAVRGFPHGYENRLCVGAGIVDSGAVHFPAAEALAWCDNFALVPLEPSAVLSLLLPLVVYTHVVLVPAVWVLVRSAVRGFLHGFENCLCAGVGLADSGVMRFPASEPPVQYNSSVAAPVKLLVLLIVLPFECMRAAPVPVASVLVCCAVWCPIWFARLLCVAVLGPISGVAARAAPVALAP